MYLYVLYIFLYFFKKYINYNIFFIDTYFNFTKYFTLRSSLTLAKYFLASNFSLYFRHSSMNGLTWKLLKNYFFDERINVYLCKKQ